MPSCVIIVENLPVPLDRRVWQEARALNAAGWDVSVICPTNARHPEIFERLEGIDIYRHPLPLEARGRTAFLVEYAAALFHEFRLLFKIWRTKGFDVVQGCNPPDLIFLIAMIFKLAGKKFVFDHHDVCPELYVAKFGRKGFFYKALLLAEKLTFRTADLVISANETYRQIAISRGGKREEDVVAVYSVPSRAHFQRASESAARPSKFRVTIGYVGIIADQDGVDQLVRCLAHLVHDMGYKDVGAVIVGDGPALESVRALTVELRVSDFVEFTGYLTGDALMSALSSFDIGMIPDPVNAYNDKISMNKVFEYSALGVPSVSYDLSETRRLLGDVGHYASEPTPLGLARACVALIDQPDVRKAAGARAKVLSNERFNWETEAARYVAAYARFKGARSSNGGRG